MLVVCLGSKSYSIVALRFLHWNAQFLRSLDANPKTLLLLMYMNDYDYWKVCGFCVYVCS